MLSFGIKNERETELGFEFDSFSDIDTEYADLIPQMLAILIDDIYNYIVKHGIETEVITYLNFITENRKGEKENVYN